MPLTPTPGHGEGGNALILSSPDVQHAIGAAHLARTLIVTNIIAAADMPADMAADREHDREHGHFPVPRSIGAAAPHVCGPRTRHVRDIHRCCSPGMPAGMSAYSADKGPRTPRTRPLCSDPRTPWNIFEARPQVLSNETDQDSMQYACSVLTQGPVPGLFHVSRAHPTLVGEEFVLFGIFVYLCWIT
jgi:hypothetical protein